MQTGNSEHLTPTGTSPEVVKQTKKSRVRIFLVEPLYRETGRVTPQMYLLSADLSAKVNMGICFCQLLAGPTSRVRVCKREREIQDGRLIRSLC